VTGLSEHQVAAAHILFALPEAQGFALAGGAALVTLGIVDRTTRDLDAFVAARPGTPPGDVTHLAQALEAALSSRGWSVVAARQHVTFTRLLAEVDGESIEVDLAVDASPLFPVERVGGIPVLAPRDLAARKVLAILDRAEGRDFSDLWALAQVLDRSSCIEWAKQLDGGVEESTIALAFRSIERLHDGELPVSPDLAPVVRVWYEQWTEELES
jgi:hypothetical protein